jgi:uncharacterized pyridoxamine 5'-phosphate oxidase family protein
MQSVLQFLRENETFYFSTMDGDQPRVRPFGAVAIVDGKLCFTTAKKKQVYEQMQKNPKVEISTTAPGGRWLRLSGVAVTDECREIKESMLEACPTLRRLYSEDDDIFCVFHLEQATATFYSFTEPPRTVTF